MNTNVGIDQITTEPNDRLTRICAAMSDLFDDHPEHEDGDRCIIFLDDGDHGGIEIHGYEDSTNAFVDLMVHIKALLAALDVDLHVQIVDGQNMVVFE